MKKKLLFIFLFLAQIVFAQADKRISVPGTKCSVIPPVGFTAATTFNGFQDIETGASIMINEIPTAYTTVVDGFTASALKTRGMNLVNKQTINLNGSTATFMNVTQQANGTTYLKQMLMFGDTNITVLVNGIYPEASKEIEGKIKDALLTTIYNSSQDDKALDAAPFSIDTDNTDFKFIKNMSGSLLYSTDGKIPTEKPMLIVSNSIAVLSIKDKKIFAEERLKKLPRGEFTVIKEIKAITIGNLNGYEIVADGKTKDDKAELVYQVILFTEKNGYYIIVGKSREDFNKYLATFKSIVATFKPR